MKKNKQKENPLMTKQVDVKKIKKSKMGVSTDENEIRSFVIIVLVIAVLVGIVYFVTNKFFSKDEEYVKTVTPGAINYDMITVGTLLNRPYDDYYVLVYDVDDVNAIKYSSVMAVYKEKSSEKDYKKIYFCDLGNSLNSKYYNVGEDNKSNPKAETIEDLDFGNVTLLEIKKGKIVKYIEKYETIKEMLSSD